MLSIEQDGITRLRRAFASVVSILVFVCGNGVVFSNPTEASSQDHQEVLSAFDKTIGVYLNLVQQKSAESEKVFDQIASKEFLAFYRSDKPLNKEQWKEHLRQMLRADEEYRYEYRVVEVQLSDSKRAVVRLEVLEIRDWHDVNGIFYPAGQTLQYQERFTWVCELVKEGSEWKWSRFACYGFGKEAQEEVALK